MVVESLRRQHLRQLPLLPAALLQLGTLVLEPDLDLVLVQPQRLGQVAPALLRQVAILLELALQPGQLLRGEGRARPLLAAAATAARAAATRTLGLLADALFDLPGTWTCDDETRRVEKNSSINNCIKG